MAMSLKVKFILVSVLLIIFSVSAAGFLGYRESKWKLKKLARDLLVAKTEQAYALCERHYKNDLEPSEELKKEIASIQIAQDGYIAVLDNKDGPSKGVLVVHPTDVGVSLYNDRFPHIMKILDEIDQHHKAHGYANFTYYQQGTVAKGRQGERKIGYFKYFAPWDWVILATGYEKDVFSSRDQLRSTLIQLAGLVIVVGVVIVYLLFGRMFQPLQQLTESTKEVARGNWDISINYNSHDEIGALAQSFDQMVRSLRKNARMWHEFQVARDMQAQMLPDKQPRVSGLTISARSIPAREVGGDFYDFLEFDDDKLGLVVGDVSGHGVSAAMVMTAAMSAVRFAAEEKATTDDVLSLVNLRLSKDIQNHMFVALFYGIIETKTRKLYYTNAGQTMPFLWRKGEVKFLPQAERGDRFPLGIERSTVYEQLSIDLEPDDILVFYTDGIVDAMNGSCEAYGFDRLSASIRKYAASPPDVMLSSLVAEMQRYSNTSEQQDDVTVVIVKVG
ncbi:MAG: HAMP domain-containing protein [Calditrichaeota bacterium]|nr:MAG: HAMP domain-containing protein [Calditrichota bacterium]